VITASSDAYGANVSSWKAFDKIVPNNTDGWTSANDGRYTPSTGAYTGSTTTTVSSVSTMGEWLQIQLPAAITLTSYIITSINFSSASVWLRSPGSWKFAGSTNGSTWTLIDTQSTVSYTAYNQAKSFTVSTSAYSYYRIICMSSCFPQDQTLVCIGEMRLFGY
jgi:hypothetical protein